MIGVKDLARSKKFYGDGLGCTIDQDHPNLVSFNLGDGSSSLASTSGTQRPKTLVCPLRVPASGVSFDLIVPSSEAVDEVIGSSPRCVVGGHHSTRSKP
jgi:catechol 2,3-dioxygenase-like lactoylglutathione lyase family enzyme